MLANKVTLTTIIKTTNQKQKPKEAHFSDESVEGQQ